MNSKAKTANGYVVPAIQHVTDYKPLKSELITIPSTNTPNFGVMFYLDVRETNLILHELILRFSMSALTGVTSSNGFHPAIFWIDHIDYIMNGNCLETVYPLDQYINTQLHLRDEDRLFDVIQQGSYNNVAQRQAMSGVASNYYIRLKDFFSQAKVIPLLANEHQLQLRIFMKPLADCVNTAVGTPVASILSCSLLARVTRLREQEAGTMRSSLLANAKLHYKHNDVKQFVNTIQSGTTSANILLSSVTGPISYLFFVIRPISTITTAPFTFVPISSFEMLNSSGSNFIGGQPIDNYTALFILGNNWSRSTFLTEVARGSVNNSAYVYMYSFAADCTEVALNAVSSGNYNFTGTEQLRLNFPTALTENHQLDLYAYGEGVIEFTRNGVKNGIFRH